MIKLFAYHHGNNGVAHYRSWQPMKYLKLDPEFQVKQLPHRTERIHWDGITGPCNVPGIGSHAEIIEKNDVIMTNFRAEEEACCRFNIASKLKKLIVDIDDDILNMPTDNPNHKHWFNNEENGKDVWAELPEGEENDKKWLDLAREHGAKIQKHPESNKWCIVQVKRHPCDIVLDELRMAHLVTVSTERMKEVYGKYNKNTVVIPNGIDFDNFSSLVKPDDGLIRIGLFGGNSHYRDWKEAAPALREILDEFPNVRLCHNPWFRAKAEAGAAMHEFQETVMLYPDYFEKLGLRDHPQVETYSGVDIEMYWEWLADKNITIGLAPLCDSVFNKSKSNIKYLEFSALRIPGVYADLDPYNSDIQHGYNGFLAGGHQDYLTFLRKLIKDADLRRVMGNRAWLDVKTRYDQKNISKKLADEIKKIMEVGDEENISDRASRAGLVLAK